MERYLLEGDNALQEALIHGSIEDIKKILYNKYGIKISSRNKIRKCKEIVNICLDTKINVNLTECNYSALLHFVIKNLDRETFTTVLTKRKDFDINALCRSKSRRIPKVTLLHFVIEERKVNFVQDLLEFGADVNARDLMFRTPLFHAVWNVENEIVKMLLNAGSNMNAEDEKGKLPMDYLFRSEFRKYPPKDDRKLPYLEIIQIFCAYGFKLDLKNRDYLMIYYACKKGLFKEVKFLLHNGANMFCRYFEDDTILHAAVSGQNFQLVEYLLHNGFNINVKNVFHETPLSKISQLRLAACLCSGDRCETMEPQVDMIEFLADNGANVDVVFYYIGDYMTPFENSIFNFAPAIMECLIELNSHFDLFREEFVFNRAMWFPFKNSIIVKERNNVLQLFTAFLATKKDDIFNVNNKELDWVKPFFEKCQLEIDEMKMTNICKNSNVSYFDLLFKNLMELTFCFRNVKIVHALDAELYKKEFPCYKFFLEKRIERIKKLKYCMEIFMIFLNLVFKNTFPVVIMDMIFSFLKPGDMRNFARALYLFPNIYEENVS